MALKKTPAGTGTRKAQAKKANAPMKNAPSAKSPRAATKAAASKAAKSMAKIANPEIRKSAAKRVATAETKAASSAAPVQQDGISAAKARMQKMINILKADCTGVTKGECDEKHFHDLVSAVSRAVTNTKKKHGIDL